MPFVFIFEWHQQNLPGRCRANISGSFNWSIMIDFISHWDLYHLLPIHPTVCLGKDISQNKPRSHPPLQDSELWMFIVVLSVNIEIVIPHQSPSVCFLSKFIPPIKPSVCLTQQDPKLTRCSNDNLNRQSSMI